MFFVLLAVGVLRAQAQDSPNNANFVDPFICASNDHGQTDVAAGIPFGMAKHCPDANPQGHSGYDYSAKEITGFSQTRFSGVACTGSGGNIRILPFRENSHGRVPRQLPYKKYMEVAQPGHYSVDLWALSQIAVDLEHTADQEAYREQAFNYSKTWKKFFRIN